MINLTLWCLSTLALGSLSAGMSKHQRDIFTKSLSEKHSGILKTIGLFLIINASILAIIFKGASIGIPTLLGLITLSALMLGLTLTYKNDLFIKLNLTMVAILVLSGVYTLIKT